METLNKESLLQIVSDIESGIKSPLEIRTQYKINPYRYYKIISEFGLKTETHKPGPKGPSGPKNTKFKRLLQGSIEEQGADPVCLDKDSFCEDCKNGMKITNLMVKYNLSLYQTRELRKQFNIQ